VYSIIALHAPFCYAVGITAMEIARARGASLAAIPAKVLKAMFTNALIIGISLGIVVNLATLPLPEVLDDALDLMARAGLPAAPCRQEEELNSPSESMNEAGASNRQMHALLHPCFPTIRASSRETLERGATLSRRPAATVGSWPTLGP
jgi:hypothetical protein